jgi:hypothetical protein
MKSLYLEKENRETETTPVTQNGPNHQQMTKPYQALVPIRDGTPGD